MTKQDIIRRYNRLHNRDKKTVTSAALDYLESKGVFLTRSVLQYWRDTPRYKYRKDTPEIVEAAYRHALKKVGAGELQPEEQ